MVMENVEDEVSDIFSSRINTRMGRRPGEGEMDTMTGGQSTENSIGLFLALRFVQIETQDPAPWHGVFGTTSLDIPRWFSVPGAFVLRLRGQHWIGRGSNVHVSLYDRDGRRDSGIPSGSIVGLGDPRKL